MYLKSVSDFPMRPCHKKQEIADRISFPFFLAEFAEFAKHTPRRSRFKPLLAFAIFAPLRENMFWVAGMARVSVWRVRMESVGIRKFKENMGHYVELLKSGQDIILTDRKKQIAKVTPIGMSCAEEAVRRMVVDGKACWGGGKPEAFRDRVRIKGKGVADAVVEDRR